MRQVKRGGSSYVECQTRCRIKLLDGSALLTCRRMLGGPRSIFDYRIIQHQPVAFQLVEVGVRSWNPAAIVSAVR